MTKPIKISFLGDASQLNGVMKSVNGRLGGVAQTAKRAFAVVAAGGGLAVGAFAGFDQAMTQSLAIMGNVSAGIRDQMGQTAREISRTTTFSSKDAAESYFFLASAGLSAEQSMAALPAVARFAQAGMFDMATATDLATDAQSALGLAVDDPTENLQNLTRVTDVFVKANTLANTSVEQISEALTNKAGSALRALGKDVEEGAAVLAVLADQGVKGAEAGTQLSIVLRDLQTKALANKEVFDEAGISVFDAAGEMRHMGDIISDLEGALDGMSDAEKKSTLLNLGFSDKSVSAITNLLGTSDAIHEYDSALREAGGTVEEVASKQMESFSNQLKVIRNRVQNVMIIVGGKLAPVILKSFKAIDRSVKATSRFFGDFKANIKPFLPLLGGLAAAIAVAVVPALIAWATSAGLTAAVMALMAASTIAAAAPAIALAVAIASVVAGLIWAYQNVETFRNVVDTSFKVIKIVIENAVAGIVDQIQTFIDIGKGVIDFYKGVFTGDFGLAWDGIKQIVSGAVDLVLAPIRRLISTAREIWDLGFLGRAASTAVDAVVGFFLSLPGRIIGMYVDVHSAAFGMGKQLIEGIANGVSGAVGFVADFAKGVGNAIISFVNEEIIQRINDAIPDKITLRGLPDINLPDNPLPRIPQLASGGPFRGAAIVGERGIEMVSGVGTVLSNAETKARGVTAGPLVGTLNVYNGTPGEVLQMLRMARRTSAL